VIIWLHSYPRSRANNFLRIVLHRITGPSRLQRLSGRRPGRPGASDPLVEIDRGPPTAEDMVTTPGLLRQEAQEMQGRRYPAICLGLTMSRGRVSRPTSSMHIGLPNTATGELIERDPHARRSHRHVGGPGRGSGPGAGERPELLEGGRRTLAILTGKRTSSVDPRARLLAGLYHRHADFPSRASPHPIVRSSFAASIGSSSERGAGTIAQG